MKLEVMEEEEVLRIKGYYKGTNEIKPFKLTGRPNDGFVNKGLDPGVQLDQARQQMKFLILF